MRFGAEWTSRQIDSLAEVDPENLPTSTDPLFVFNYISLNNVDGGRLLGYTSESFGTAPSRARRVLRTDDVLMSTVRPALQGHLLFSGQIPNAVCSTGFAVLRTNRHRCDPRFLFAHLFGDVVAAQVQGLLAGSNYPAINSGDVGRLWVTCPPTVAEQRAIAAVLSDVDGLIGSLETLIAKKRAIKRAAMQQLLTGRTRLPGFEGEWGTRRIDALATVDPENLPSRTDPGFAFNYISLDHVDAGRLLGSSRESFATAPSRARRVLRIDDVLMSTVRPALQGHLFYSGQVPNAICSTGFAVLRARGNEGDPRFLFAHLFGDFVAAQLQRLLAGSNYPAINSGDVARMGVTCPPTLAEQSAIATVLSDMDAEIAALECRLDKTRSIKQGMMQQLLTGAVRLPIPDGPEEKTGGG
ncbi:MAG: restriction endonuclease subunit S [Bryobacterales bacterium]|nr:restriction endonuclease subunit S [Bryobacterales bacterium]